VQQGACTIKLWANRRDAARHKIFLSRVPYSGTLAVRKLLSFSSFMTSGRESTKKCQMGRNSTPPIMMNYMNNISGRMTMVFLGRNSLIVFPPTYKREGFSVQFTLTMSALLWWINFTTWITFLWWESLETWTFFSLSPWLYLFLEIWQDMIAICVGLRAALPPPNYMLKVK